MLIPRFLLTALCGLSAACALAQPGVAIAPPAERGEVGFVAVVTRIDHRTAQQMRGVSWKRGCPVPIRDLRNIRMTHRGFDAKVHWGQLVVHEDVARRVVRVFRKMYAAGFPIRRMHRIERYNGSDDRSMAADNTSAFNCRRPDQINAPVRLSPHANGRAIDINPVENPWIDLRCNCWQPSATNRARRTAPGVITHGGTVWRVFTSRGWKWQNIPTPDYMHFDTGYPSAPLRRTAR
jgi:hypothetical protein